LTTVQFDFNLPARFGLQYVAEDGAKHQPLMVHRALLGSVERFFGILIEHYAGAFPLWLAPVQVEVCPVSEKVADYAKHVEETLKRHNLRAHLDDRNEKLPAKNPRRAAPENSLHAGGRCKGSGSRHRLPPPSRQGRPRP